MSKPKLIQKIFVNTNEKFNKLMDLGKTFPALHQALDNIINVAQSGAKVGEFVVELVQHSKDNCALKAQIIEGVNYTFSTAIPCDSMNKVLISGLVDFIASDAV